MKPSSWSTTIFLKLNALQGVSRPLDWLMFVAANVFVHLLALFVAVYALVTWWHDVQTLELFLVFLIAAFGFGLGTSWWIGWMWPHRRPIIEHPNIKQMFQPMSTWKSFPSDHTIVAFTLAESLFLFGVPMSVGVALIIVACFIGVSRVYAGVHYPRDIAGGVIFASISSLLAATILGII